MKHTILSLLIILLFASCHSMRSELVGYQDKLYTVESNSYEIDEGTIHHDVLFLFQEAENSDPRYGRIIFVSILETETGRKIPQINCLSYTPSFNYNTTFILKTDKDELLFRDMEGIRIEEEVDLVRETLGGQLSPDQVEIILSSEKFSIHDFGKAIRLTDEEVKLLKDFLSQI